MVPKIIVRYLFIIGILFHLIVLILGMLSLRTVVSSGYPLPIYAEKVLQNIRVNYPSIDHIFGSSLAFISNWQTDIEYSYIIEVEKWQGVGATASNSVKHLSAKVTYVDSNESLFRALKHAVSGDTIKIQAGVYELNTSRITLFSAGKKEAPISLVAERLGYVKLKIRGEGFLVDKPYWSFQNLHIIGNCTQHSLCEHAFHVVGGGKNASFKNNILQDFNAAIKVNGLGKVFPDNGVVEGNTIFNTSIRKTVNPVTPIDLMHANNWRVSNNFIFDFLKGSGNKISYGAFFKGGSSNGEFSRNLVICQANLKSNSTAIGLSLGGGGSPESWRRGQSTFEHDNGTIINNIIMNCPDDVGIYLNRAKDSKVANNIIYNTLGIDIRFKESSSFVAKNILSGRIKTRNSGKATYLNNTVLKRSFFTVAEPLDDIFVAPANGDFSWKTEDSLIDRNENRLNQPIDFCNKTSEHEYSGAFSGVFCRERVNLENPERQRKGHVFNEK